MSRVNRNGTFYYHIKKVVKMPIELVANAELIRRQTSADLDPSRQKTLAQFFTPLPIAELMASLFIIDKTTTHINILDPGAGVGILSAVLIDRIVSNKFNIKTINLTAFESDDNLIPQLKSTLKLCELKCNEVNIKLTVNIINDDFIERACDSIKSAKQLFQITDFADRFDFVIMNPPYKKIHSTSKHRAYLHSIDIETSNLYTAFLALSVKILKENGQLAAITPRSFTNGPYFKSFRNLFFFDMKFRRIHIFNSRNKSFSEDEVLQENIIFHAVKTKENKNVIITSSDNPADDFHTSIELHHNNIVSPKDHNKIIHLITDINSKNVIEKINSLNYSLHKLKIEVSTGRVIDFRINKYLSKEPTEETVPLIYPLNFDNGMINWPKENKKATFIINNKNTADLLLDTGFYVLCRRFSSKEEKRRIVAALFNPNDYKFNKIGFENHLNVFHSQSNGLDQDMAKGLTIFLNSTIIDLYFRIFNGHTQVNATDLRMLRFPSKDQLKTLGKSFRKFLPSQNEIDNIIEKELFNMKGKIDPVKVDRKIKEAINLLKDLGIPRAQQNERSALTLLALLNLKPDQNWIKSTSPLMGITEMMNFFKDHYGKVYAPNTRETVRRFSVHQFVQAGLVIPNPDETRPVNSPNYVYQIEASALNLIKKYNSKQWKQNLSDYLLNIETLSSKYAQERELQKIPIKISNTEVLLSPGGQNILVKKIIDDFCTRFTPGAEIIYIGDAENKWVFFDKEALLKLGIRTPDVHGKMPDVIVHFKKKNWLVLIEAVTSHGPINSKRKIELEELFKGCKIGLVFITAFLDRHSMLRFLNDIAWETEVWIAESPSHLIHFNGKRFLGPYVEQLA